MKLIVGLGNIGDNYKLTRHNAGFMFVNYLSKQFNFTFKTEKKFNADVAKVEIDGESVIFVKPNTYMNLSGQSVSKIAKFYSIKNEDVLIIFDDLDQDFGKVKFKLKSSHGGHNGMRSIIGLMGTQEIPRMKIGIGRHNHMPVEKWVLSKFSKDEIKDLNDIFQNNEKFINNFIKIGFTKALNG